MPVELIAIIVGIVVSIIVLLFLHVFTVKEQQAIIIELTGRFRRVCGPGVHFKWPFEQRRKFIENGEERDFVDQRERSFTLESLVAITKDGIQVQVDSIAFYQISEPERAVYGVDDVIFVVNNLLKTVLRDVIGDTMLTELISGRESLNMKLKNETAKATGDWGISVRRVELQAVIPPQTYTDAVSKCTEAELEKKAEIVKAEGRKQALILEAEGETHAMKLLLQEISNGKQDFSEQIGEMDYFKLVEKILDRKRA